MATVKLKEIYAWERGLLDIHIAKWLTKIDSIEPIHIIELEGMKIVRDGHHRVVAWITYHENKGIPIPEIPYVKSTKPIRDTTKELMVAGAEYYGSGANAFQRIPIASIGEINARQTEMERIIQQHLKK